LQHAELPTDDIAEHVSGFLVAEEASGGITGAVALERYDDVGLLRSLVVTRASRGHGLATRLCRTLLARAQRRGLQHVYLLTIDADGFFARLGFTPIDRSLAPASIGDTREFSSLCPATAVFMHRRLPAADASLIDAPRAGEACE
jgi:amino-acid N-acetyltransferase